MRIRNRHYKKLVFVSFLPSTRHNEKNFQTNDHNSVRRKYESNKPQKDIPFSIYLLFKSLRVRRIKGSEETIIKELLINIRRKINLGTNNLTNAEETNFTPYCC